MSRCADHFGVEIVFVLNADTGYVFNLSNELYEEVIVRFRASLFEYPFISGVTAVGASPTDFQGILLPPPS